MPELYPLPLFPLHTVLFPGALLPIHVFEPRYRLMIARCLDAASPFGVVLIRAGREVGDAAEPYAFGTKARIVHHERLDDGRMHLACAGTTRFRIAELHHDEPYLTGRVEPVDEGATEPAAGAAAERARAAFERFVASLGTTASPDLRLPSDPAELSFALAAVLLLPLAEQQLLLELTSTLERLERLTATLERELQLRRRVGLTRPAAPGQIRPPSPN